MGWIAGWVSAWDQALLGLGASTTFPGYGDSGVSTLLLELDNGYQIKHNWITDIIKARAGNEQRVSRNEIDHQSFSGTAFLVNAQPRQTRAQLARSAASGVAFLLGMPHEAIMLSGPTDLTTVPVFSTEFCDWATAGQRAAVVYLDEDGEPVVVECVIQSSTIDEITVDIEPDVPGGWIMPLRHIFLEPQQNFPRFESQAESWSLDARSAKPLDFAPALARLELGPITVSAAFDNVAVASRQFGLIGNTFTFALQSGGPANGELVEADGEVQFNYSSGVTTLGDLRDALAYSSFEILDGDYNASDTIASGDAFSSTPLTGGEDHGAAGAGATLINYLGDGTSRPVWTREINIESSITDGVQSMTQILDHGGIPYALQTADRSDWFRAVTIFGGDREDWQYLKLFMATVRGRQKKFWLPTWREDLVYVSHSGTQLTIYNDSDFAAWWPSQREHIQIKQGQGGTTHAKINSVVDNMDGTLTLTISTSLDIVPITLISWLELCRFEDADQYTTNHNQQGFDVQLTARVVQ